MHKSTQPDIRPLVAASLGICLLAGGARGDVKIVSQVTITHSVPAAQTAPTITFHPGGAAPRTADTATPAAPPTPAPQIVTTYFKGGSARAEVAGGPVTLYNGAEGKVYTLDPDRKTYFVRSSKDIQPPPDPAGGAAAIKVNADLSLSPGGGTRTFAGIPARVFILSGTVTAAPERSGGRPRGGGGFGGGGRHRRGGGGFPGSGGFPGGEYPGGGDEGGGPPSESGTRPHARVVEVSGEYWLSDALKVPDDRKANLLPAFPAADPSQAYLFKSLADNLGKKKEIPLDSRITLTYASPQGGQETVTTTTEITAVSSSALSDALFQFPVGYTQVAPPPL